MRWDYHTVFKQIREDKRLSQSKVAGSMMSRQAIASFEDGKSTPRFENMEYMLRQMDITFAEFQHICDYYQPNERMKIMQKIQQLNSLTDKEYIETLIKQCQDYLKTREDVPVERRLLILQRYQMSYDENTPGQSEQSKQLFHSIWKELQRYDEWYLGDLALLVSILPDFPIETVIDMTNQILKSLKRYEGYANINEARFSILSNLGTAFLYNNHPKNALQMTEMALTTANQTHRSDYLGFCWVRLGVLRKDFTLIQKGLQLLEIAGENQTLKNCKKEVAHFHPTVPLD